MMCEEGAWGGLELTVELSACPRLSAKKRGPVSRSWSSRSLSIRSSANGDCPLFAASATASVASGENCVSVVKSRANYLLDLTVDQRRILDCQVQLPPKVNRTGVATTRR